MRTLTRSGRAWTGSAAPDGSIDSFPVTEDVMEFSAATYPETLPTHVRQQLGGTVPRHGWLAVLAWPVRCWVR
jgi:hypothetical protein